MFVASEKVIYLVVCSTSYPWHVIATEQTCKIYSLFHMILHASEKNIPKNIYNSFALFAFFALFISWRLHRGILRELRARSRRSQALRRILALLVVREQEQYH
jgi:hypothetical protein